MNEPLQTEITPCGDEQVFSPVYRPLFHCQSPDSQRFFIMKGFMNLTGTLMRAVLLP
jgi:hypothetical protein